MPVDEVKGSQFEVARYPKDVGLFEDDVARPAAAIRAALAEKARMGFGFCADGHGSEIRSQAGQPEEILCYLRRD